MKNLLVFFVALSLLTFAPRAHAGGTQDLLVTPAVIDEKAKARDILKETITVRNMTNHVLQLYPSVTDTNVQDGSNTFNRAGDSEGLSNSLANWIELSRGMVQLGPGEERSIPFIIRVNMNAVNKIYHAQISLTEGETRAVADSKPPLGTVTVNLEIAADVKEILQLEKFNTGNIFFSGDDILFNYKLQNIGNQELLPKGQIRIYDRKGKEVAAVDVNKGGRTVSPEQDAQLASVWSAASGFGRYKAMLDVAYGSSQTASLQDTVFFWIIPWKQMLMMFITSLITIVVLALYFHRWLERRHLYKFAHAGLLNDDTLKTLHTQEVEQVHPELPLPEPKMFTPRPRTKEKPPQHGQREPHEHKSLKEVLHKEEVPTAHGHSIDLKQLRAHTQAANAHAHHAPQAHHDAHAEVNGHVISLKKKEK